MSFITQVLNLSLPTTYTGVLPSTNGGTGLSSVGTSGNGLVSTGTAWSSATVPVNLASATGVLGASNGGTGVSSLTANNLIIGNGTGAVSFVAPGSTGNSAVSNGTTWTSGVAGATWVTKTANYTAVSGDQILADTTSAAFTITLPASPSTNNTVYFQDAKGTWATNNLTIAPGSNNIMGQAGNLTVNQSGTGFGLIYNGTEWRIF